MVGPATKVATAGESKQFFLLRVESCEEMVIPSFLPGYARITKKSGWRGELRVSVPLDPALNPIASDPRC